jgi:pimeloyl-ACP methyl ester carboxylesterase
MNPAFQLILMPGLGADHRLLGPQREAFPQLVIPPWIPPRKNESLPDYAARMAETITPSRESPLVLGGVSFGGMVAYEMARRLKPDAVVLIASSRKRESLSPVYRAGRRLLPWIPYWVWSIAKFDLISGVVVRLRLGVAPSQRDLAIRMFRDADSRFMHWVLQAILNWDPKPLAGVRVLQIHGGRDSLIPARRVEADRIIPDGGHMINLTHADQVNAFIYDQGYSHVAKHTDVL